MTRAASIRLIDGIGKWMKRIDSQPGWKEWQRKKIAALLMAAEGMPLTDGLEEFEFAEPLKGQHSAVMSYFALHNSFEALKQCEYYFRRYPFRGLPSPNRIIFATCAKCISIGSTSSVSD